jgi:acyl-CoA synthetase (AMP-forming)/AMP-acid ligase II
MLSKRLEVGTAKGSWARTGMLGFLERCEDSKELSLYFIGNMNEHIQHRGFQFHPTDLEASLRRCNSSIINCCVCQVDGHMICLIETTKEASFCPILASKITSTLSDVHHVIISVVVLLRPSSIPMSTQGTPQRQRAAEMLLQDKFNPILMSYNC